MTNIHPFSTHFLPVHKLHKSQAHRVYNGCYVLLPTVPPIASFLPPHLFEFTNLISEFESHLEFFTVAPNII